jgi:hypothetical protein
MLNNQRVYDINDICIFIMLVFMDVHSPEHWKAIGIYIWFWSPSLGDLFLRAGTRRG